MSPAKTIETLADHLTDRLEKDREMVDNPAVFGLLNDIAVRLSGFRLLKLTDAGGRTVGFTTDKKPVSEFLPDPKPTADPTPCLTDPQLPDSIPVP